MKPDILYNSKGYFDNLSNEGFIGLPGKSGFEYNITDKIIKECLIWKS